MKTYYGRFFKNLKKMGESDYLSAKKVIAFLVVLMIILENSLASANVIFDNVTYIKGGNETSAITEQKIQNLMQYQMQYRNPTSTTTLVENNKGGFLEFDRLKQRAFNLDSTGSASYDFSYGKAIYDANIGILDLPNTASGRLTYEAPYYCDLLISSLAKFTKIGNNICLPNYSNFLTEYNKNLDRTYVSIVKTQDIAGADLSHFGILIFPDITLSKHPEILDSFGSGGIAKIKAFVDNGGMVYFSSKSLIIADKMGLTDGIIDENTLIKHHTNQGKITLEQRNDFTTNLLNHGLYEGNTYASSKTGSGYYDYLLGSYYINEGSDPGVVPVRRFDIAGDSNYYFQDLTTQENASLDTNSAISAFYKPYGKGQIIYNGGNSLFTPQSNSHKLFLNHTLNSILLSFLREVYSSAKVIQMSNPDISEKLVPALENNIVLKYEFESTNVYNRTVNNPQLNITIATGGLAITTALPSECVLASNSGSITCNKATLAPSEKWHITFGLTVTEPTFTQAGTNITVTSSRLFYTESNGLPVEQNLSRQTVDSVDSANMRAALNIDPAGYYPLLGRGVYIDQVLNTENKGSTEATSVDYTVSVPLISPLFDESNQSMLTKRIVFSKNYHNSLVNESTKTNYYPFKNTGTCTVTDYILGNRCKDFVIPKLFPTNSVKVDNYDEPVQRDKTDDDDALANVNTGSVGTELGGNIMKQSYMPDADMLFRHASPRQMIFEYPAKTELLFARQDVYFYNNPAFPLPKGISNFNKFITIDKNNNCTKIDGSYGYPNGVIAGQYPNALVCNPAGENLSWINEKIDYDNLPAGLEKSEYLFPISPENNITDASELEGFDALGNYIGQKDDAGNTSNTYPIKFVKGSYTSFYLPARSTPKGGMLEFDLPDGVSADGAYILADHIAITKTEIIGNHVKAYFYRGKLPNEQSLKSIIGIALTGVDQDMASINLKVSSLKYDLSKTDINSYNEERQIIINFKKYSFFKLPAVKMTFELPRRKRISEDDIINLNLTDGQINVLFSRPDYYNKSLVFKAISLSNLGNLLTQARVNSSASNILIETYIATPTESYVRRRENLEPFVRFGTYIQELAFHRTVWGTAEDHPISDPGIMANTAMFGNVGNVGISPIPFAQYLTTGKSQIIPLATENARVDYKDIFGRQFAAPIRTTVPEAVPLPPPLRNFQMNTTYEMYDRNGNLKTTWDGEEDLEIRQNIKLYNNYPKFFNPTICTDNQSGPYYGGCWDGTGSSVTGYNLQTSYSLLDKLLDPIDNFWITNIKLFSTKVQYDSFMSDLQSRLTASGLTNYTVPTLKRTENNKGNIVLSPGEFVDDKARNYSPEVENYYPENYIANNMWNLTHFDYDDSVYSKGYPYHMDNQLPNPHSDDYWNPAKYLPHNIIAVPISRGVSYKTKYFSEEPSYMRYETQNNGRIESNITPYSSWKYSNRKGWWPENLQNKDGTLLAGQASVNNIPYEKNGTEYLKPNLISSSDFESAGNLTNIYSCLFNPTSLINNSSKFQYKANVLLNNVIPIIPWIQKENENASYLSNYNCNSQPYTENTMNKINNIVETEDAYWLYFASNLRGEAKEALNVINRLTPYPGVTYEGDTKVIEGGRFTYWNPALGPNAFEIVDNPVSIIKTVNSKVTVDKELIPYNLKNYKTDAYLLYTVKDPGEIFLDANGKETPRKWKDETYIDSRGDGNYGASVYVGASYNKAATKALMDPGDTSLVRIDIGNNSGYDWEMIGEGTVANDNGQYTTHISGGIDFTIIGNQPLNANDLLNKVTRNVLKPERFNFMTFDIPDEIKPFVTITPSDANILTPGTFFDFDFVNVTTIRDGFKGSYFVDLKVDLSIPDNLRAKVYDIKATIKPEYFKHIPSPDITKDPAKWGVVPNIPDIKFAIADANNNAYYRSGFSTGVTFDVAYNSGFTFDKAYELNEFGVNAMRLAAGDGTHKHQRLRETFENLNSSGFSIREMTGTEGTIGNNNKVSIDFTNNGINEFPYINSSGSIVPKSYIVVHLKKESLSDGEQTIESSDTISYNNYAGKSKNSVNTTPLVGYAQGPKLDISYRSALIGNAPGDNLEIQKLVEGDNQVELKLFIKNTGSDIAFDPSFSINVATGVTIDTGLTQNATINGNIITFKNLFAQTGGLQSEGEAIGPGITNYFPVYLTYSGSFTDDSINLVNSASYEFRPYDPTLPALSGSYSTGLTLDYAKTNVAYDKSGQDGYNFTFSGNTVGIYWDVLDGTGVLDSKLINSGSEVVNKSYSLDPTENHNLSISSYFKTKNGTFKKLKDFTINLIAEDPFLRFDSKLTSGGTNLRINLKSNKLGKYNGYYDIVASQGNGFTGKILTSNNGNIVYNLSNVDITRDTTVTVRLYSLDNYLTGGTFVVAREVPNVNNAKAERIGENTIKISFKTNKAKDSCYGIYKSGALLNNDCIEINGEASHYNDVGVDVFKDIMYRVEIFDDNSSPYSLASDIPYTSPNPDSSSTPLKLLDSDSINSNITFNKVKDFSGTYMVDGTPVRYSVKMRIPGKPYASHFSQDSSIEVRYASGQTIYAGDNWNFALNSPIYVSGASFSTDFQNIKEVELGSPDTPFVFSEYNRIIINNIWEKPDRISTIHDGVLSQIQECVGLPRITNECWSYDVNKVNIYTKRFSKFILSKYAPRSSGGGMALSLDYCPNGDNSPSYYDHSCIATQSLAVVTINKPNLTTRKKNLPSKNKNLLAQAKLFTSPTLTSYDSNSKQLPHKIVQELDKIVNKINTEIKIKSTTKASEEFKQNIISKLNSYSDASNKQSIKRYITYILRKLN